MIYHFNYIKQIINIKILKLKIFINFLNILFIRYYYKIYNNLFVSIFIENAIVGIDI